MNKLENKFRTAIDLLTSHGKFHIKLGLERCQGILELLGKPQKKLNYIHVAGTNGKGSVCSTLSAILSNSGFRTGLFTSPHIFEYTERIKINDIEISKADFGEIIIEITELADTNNIHLTEFEIITVAAFYYFAENKVDIVILETGLGGRLDATNVIEKNICSIITNIDLDHTERLGNTIEKIAYEKSGIIKENSPVIIDRNNLGFKAISDRANVMKSKVFHPQIVSTEIVEGSLLKGEHQKENLGLVLSAIKILNENGFSINLEQIKSGLAKIKHPCRFEHIEKEYILIDGAHNPNGTMILRENLNLSFPNQKFKFIFGCLKNKDYQNMMKNLFRVGDDIYFYQFDNENACSYQDLANACKLDSKPFSEFKKDVTTLTVICGSFYMIKELLEKMGLK